MLPRHSDTFADAVDRYPGWMDSYPMLLRSDTEPVFGSVEETRLHRQRRCALAYRVFGALGWGTLGDGHISARDPELVDHFWLLKYGVPFGRATVADMVLVGPGGRIVQGTGDINMTAYHIHGPIHDARPEIVSAAHTHTPYGTPWAANAALFAPICQEVTAFFEDHSVFDDGEVQVRGVEGGKRIAVALGESKATILRNHGLLTVGESVDEAVGWFLLMERVAEVHVKAPNAKPISAESARIAKEEIGDPTSAWSAFQFALRSKVPDPNVVG